MFGFAKKTAKWDPTLERFPEINVESIAKELGIDKRGKDDGSSDQPPAEALLLTSAEQTAVEAVGKLRREALTNYELELQALRQRIASAKSDTSEIRLKIGDAMSALERLEREEELRLEPARRDVAAYQGKVEHFLQKHGAVAPPKPMKGAFFTFAFMAFLFVFESLMNGFFFAERNDMGVVGGVGQAAIISLINLAVGFLAGFFQRYVNLKGFFHKVIGCFAVLAWLAIAVPFNLAVAHFRNALETALPWEEALRQAVELTMSEPLQLDSLSSWMLLLIGLIVTFSAFLKGAWIGDPIPGFNSIWDQSEFAMNRYSDAFNSAHTELDDRFMEERDALQAEVGRRRADLRSATDALLSRKAMSSGLEVFLETADSAANMLLKRYREANQRARKSPVPKYFNEEFRFERPNFSDFEDLAGGRELVEAEIARMERLVEVGVSHLMQAQKRSLLAFPTIEEIRSGRTEKKILAEESPLNALSKAIEEIAASETAPVHTDGVREKAPQDDIAKVTPEAPPAATQKRGRNTKKPKPEPDASVTNEIEH